MDRYKRSRELFTRAQQFIPGGVSSNNRANWTPFPLFYDHAIGSRIWDVDGNEYIDYLLGRGPMIMGHSTGPFLEETISALRSGQFYAGQTESEIELAELIAKLVPCAEMVRFCNSGSEAVHAAVRLARAATGRKKIVRFEGHYHGWYDTIAWGFSPASLATSTTQESSPQPMSLGQWPEDAQNLSVLPWNNLEAVAAELHRLDGQVAAVITEPVMYNGLVSGVKPKDDFLRGLRTLCDENGCLLIFDEIITGFRLSLGGAQEFFSVTPDIVTLAKALGGGAPISAVAGRRDLMSLFGSGTVVHTGTYNGHPAAVAGALMTLRALSRNNGHLISVISDSGNALKSGIEALGSRSRLPLQVRGFGPAFTVVFRNSRDEPIDARSALNGLDHDLMRRWHTTLQAWGVRTSPEGLWYISSAHTSTDVALTIERVQKSLRDLEDAYH